MIHIYYGDGKGKTTAALGLSLRACGAGKKVLFISFLKNNSSSERAALCSITFYNNPDSIPFLFNMTEKERIDYAQWCVEAVSYAFKSDYDVIVLDEFLDVLDIIDSEIINNLSFNGKKEYIITGHSVNSFLFETADYITQMKNKKHPYDKGVSARKGIEY